jgi:hypothetical protein
MRERVYPGETDICHNINTDNPPTPPAAESALGLQPDFRVDKAAIYVLLCSLNTSKPTALQNEVYEFSSHNTEYALYHTQM